MTGGRDNLNDTRVKLSAEITEIKLSVIELQKEIEAQLTSAENLENMINSRGKRAEEIEKMISALEVTDSALLEITIPVALSLDGRSKQGYWLYP